MTTQIWIVLIAAITVIGVLVAILQLRGIGRREMRSKKRLGYHDVLVRDAVNIRTQQYGSGTGTYFHVSEELDATVVAGKEHMARWHVQFLNQGTGHQYRISFSDKMSIGRKSPELPGEAKLVLREDRLISKNHCLIFGNESGLIIQDAGSHNHTYLNGSILNDPAWLNQGDELTLGNTKLKVRFARE